MTLIKAQVSRHTAGNDGGSDGADDPNGSMAILESLGAALVAKRDEAIQWRIQSGIEEDWQEDEDFYDARDRANPEGETNVGKPLSADGGAENQPQAAAGRSSVFIPITRAYVDAASARVSDMLLPNDDAPWHIKPTPRPDMAEGSMGNVSPVAAAAAGVAGTGPMPPIPQGLPGLMQPNPGAGSPAPTAAAQPAPMGGNPGMGAAGGMPPGMPMPMGVSSQVYDALPEEEKRSERANQVIEDWLIECQWHAEMRKVIEDCAMVGTGVIKGPFPMVRKSRAYVRDPITGTFTMREEKGVKPISRRVHYRNFWPMPDGGEDHQSGSGVWELDNISSRKLRDLLDDDTYIGENIRRALREGPGAKSGKDSERTAGMTNTVQVGSTFPLWYFYGDIDKRTMIAAGIPDDMLPEGEEDEVAISALCFMVNDHVIKVAQTPLDGGGFPYDMMPWQRRPGIPWGKGVARQIRTPQRMLNAAVRAEMDNGALTSGPMYAIRQGWILAIDGDNATLTPRKGFYMTENAPPNAKIEDAISFTNIESNVQQLEMIIERAMRFAEDATGLPMLMQGQQGEATTTATGMTILNNNGSTVLRRIARTFDDHITEPHIRRYYDWLMSHPGNDDAKGDFQIDARGSTYLVDRELQAQNLNQLFPILLQHPDIHPGRLAEEVANANRLPIKRIFLTDAEKKQRDSQPPPKPIQLQVAEANNQSRETIAKATIGQRDQDSHRKAQIAEGQLQATVEGKLAEIAKDMNISEDSLKAMLAVAVMGHHGKERDAQRQQQEAGIDRAHERTSAMEERDANPPAEKPGKAPAGAAFAQ